MTLNPDLARQLAELHDDFAWQVNAAVAEHREDLVKLLVDRHTEAALELLLHWQPTSPAQ